MEGENKAFDMKIEDGELRIVVDPNKDGTPVIKLQVDLAEVPDEVISALKKD